MADCFEMYVTGINKKNITVKEFVLSVPHCVVVNNIVATHKLSRNHIW